MSCCLPQGLSETLCVAQIITPDTSQSLTRSDVGEVSCDPALDPGIGTCGKDGQSVPVGVGLPTMRIDDVTVGGTNMAGGRA